MGPDGKVLLANRQAPLDRDKAQYFVFIGKRTPAGGWPSNAPISSITRSTAIPGSRGSS